MTGSSLMPGGRSAASAPPRSGDPACSPWRLHATRIAAIRDEAPGVRTYSLAFPAARHTPPFRFAAGQFNMISLPGIGEAAISISSDPESLSGISHTVRAVGNVTRALARLDVGDELLIRGPYGSPWPLDALRDRDLVLVGGGLGLASLLAAIAFCLTHRGDYGRIAVLHGTKTPADLLATRDHARWRDHGIDVHGIVAAPDDQARGPVGLVTALFDDLDLDPCSTSLLCCGPEPMMTAVAEQACGRGVARNQIFASIERLMGCGAGLCGLCQLGPFFICRDGPVFSYDRIARWLAVPHL
ncbi:MAG: FAD/NAD(P)-binding protein [Planctomycetia bacterium]